MTQLFVGNALVLKQCFRRDRNRNLKFQEGKRNTPPIVREGQLISVVGIEPSKLIGVKAEAMIDNLRTSYKGKPLLTLFWLGVG